MNRRSFWSRIAAALGLAAASRVAKELPQCFKDPIDPTNGNAVFWMSPRTYETLVDAAKRGEEMRKEPQNYVCRACGCVDFGGERTKNGQWLCEEHS